MDKLPEVVLPLSQRQATEKMLKSLGLRFSYDAMTASIDYMSGLFQFTNSKGDWVETLVVARYLNCFCYWSNDGLPVVPQLSQHPCDA
jgi:hypothetical protein